MIKTRMPVVFTGHGYPMNAITDNPARAGWHRIGESIGRPKVIIAMTGHWESDGTYVHTASDNPQLFDIEDLPDEIYDVRYKPDNSVEYAHKVIKLLGDNAFADNTWGIDHALWTTLSNMYPKADIPVVVISTNTDASPREMLETGRALRPLRDEGALIFATGNIVHNVDLVDHSMSGGLKWAVDFDRNIKELIFARDWESLINYTSLPDRELAIPTIDHYYPLLFAIGASYEDDQIEVFNEYTELASLSMTSYLFR